VENGIIAKFFQPKSIALIGATNTPGFGYGIPRFWGKNGWLDKAYLVNPKGGQLQGREVYRTISELPDGIDLAVVIVPASNVREVLVELGNKGIHAVIVESAGFAEIGDQGQKRQDELLETAREYGIRLLGPNCVGVVNTENRFATAEIMTQSLEPGSVAIIAQSGVFGNILLDYLPEAGLKISKVATMGNKIDLDESDFLEYFIADPNTKVILIYEEGIKDGQRFLKALRRSCKKKPVIILKSGRTPFGRQATLSHTASLSGEDRVYDAAFRQAGAIRADNILEMIDMARVFSTQPPMKGRKIGILTSSGSLGAMTADAIYDHGMELASWSQETTEKINHAAPGWLNIKNPLDMGPSGLFSLACQTIFGDPNVDGFILIPVVPYAAIEGFLQLGVNAKLLFGEWQGFRQKFEGKPVVAVLLGNKEWLNQIRELCGDSIATVNTPEAAAKTLAALHRYSQKYKNDSKPLF
jgi:acyl-CoA synthetase (NDP forming)